MPSIVSRLRCINARCEGVKRLACGFGARAQGERMPPAAPTGQPRRRALRPRTMPRSPGQRRRRNSLLHPQPLRRHAHHLRQPRHPPPTQHPSPDRLVPVAASGDLTRSAAARNSLLKPSAPMRCAPHCLFGSSLSILWLLRGLLLMVPGQHTTQSVHKRVDIKTKGEKPDNRVRHRNQFADRMARHDITKANGSYRDQRHVKRLPQKVKELARIGRNCLLPRTRLKDPVLKRGIHAIRLEQLRSKLWRHSIYFHLCVATKSFDKGKRYIKKCYRQKNEMPKESRLPKTPFAVIKTPSDVYQPGATCFHELGR